MSSRTTIKINEKTLIKQRWGIDSYNALRHLEIQMVSATLEQRKTTSWTPMGQETDKSPASTNTIVSFMFGLSESLNPDSVSLFLFLPYASGCVYVHFTSISRL